MSAPLTIGVEEEFHLVDTQDRSLTNAGAALLAELEDIGENRFQLEIKQSMIETSTAVCTSLQDIRDNLTQLRRGLVTAAEKVGCAAIASGTAPMGHWRDGVLTPDDRYEQIVNLHQQVVWEQVVCGCHVHIGIDDRDLAVQILNRVRPWLSSLLALSASSPYWLDHDTGYASYRTTIWWRWPTAHVPSTFESAAEYDDVVSALVKTGTVVDAGQVYWDVRLSPKQATLEFRVADTCTTIDEAVVHAALCRALATTARDEALRGDAPPQIRPELLRAAKWRAARFGVSDLLLDPWTGESIPAKDRFAQLLEHLRPALLDAGEWDEVNELVDQIVRDGTSADRQRRAHACNGRLADVVDLLAAETAGA